MLYTGRNKVTSPRGYRTLGGVTKWHPGIDVVGLDSKEILSTITGVVEAVGSGSLAGKYVRVKIDNSTKAYYFHLSKQIVKAGQKIKPGDVIGVEGSTGNSTGSHLHFEIRVNGANVDPTPYCGLTNAVGIYTQQAESVEKVKIVDVYANAASYKTGKPAFNVQVFSEPDVNKVVQDYLPDGRYWCNESGVALENCDLKGAQIMLGDTPVYVAMRENATEYTEMSPAEAYNRFVLKR